MSNQTPDTPQDTPQKIVEDLRYAAPTPRSLVENKHFLEKLRGTPSRIESLISAAREEGKEAGRKEVEAELLAAFRKAAESR